MIIVFTEKEIKELTPKLRAYFENRKRFPALVRDAVREIAKIQDENEKILSRPEEALGEDES